MHGRRRAVKPNPARGLSPAAQREAEWLKGRPDKDKAIIHKAAEDFSYLLRLEQKGDFESYYFWGAYEAVSPLSSEDHLVTSILGDASQVAKLLSETGNILRTVKMLNGYEVSPYNIAPSFGIYDRISRDELENRLLTQAEQKMANVFKILKVAGIAEQ
jgi:hypothetical protein